MVVLAAGSVSAARLEPKPRAKVNDGNGYRTVVAASTVNPADQVLVPSGASPATIIYDNGCREEIPVGVVYDVQENITCDQPGAALDSYDFAIGAIVVGGAIGGVLAFSNNGSNDNPVVVPPVSP